MTTEAYDKLIYIATKEDRAIGRQLARVIDEEYERITRTELPMSNSSGIGGLSAVIDS